VKSRPDLVINQSYKQPFKFNQLIYHSTQNGSKCADQSSRQIEWKY